MNGRTTTVLGYVTSGLMTLFGGFCPLLRVLVILSVLDYIAGAAARYIKREPWEWRKSYEGAIKKFVLYPIAIIAAVGVDSVLESQGIHVGEPFRRGMLFVLMGKELVSLLGHLKTCDIPVLGSLLELAEKWRSGKNGGRKK